MVLTIDGKKTEAIQGSSILDAINSMSDTNDMKNATKLKDRPLAARIGGEIYSLNYTPHHDCDIHLLRYDSREGKRVYERTLQFVFLAAVDELFPNSEVTIAYTLGTGLYTKIQKSPALCSADIEAIKSKMHEIVDSAIPLIRKRLPINKATEYFSSKRQFDKTALLSWRRFSFFDVYSMQDKYMDYYYGEMAPDTGYAKVFDLCAIDNALLLLVPDSKNPDIPSKYIPQPKLSVVFKETDYWDSLMDCSTVSELNEHIRKGTINEIVRVNEALHEKRYANIADKIVERKARAVLIAGPSSSGKTTSANRLSTQLRALGQKPVMLSMDDYYLDRADMIPDENGQYDFEHINTLDIPRFNHDLALLLHGDEVDTPLFDFTRGARKKECRTIKLCSNQPLIIEGIHALNPSLL
ncbi:MAG: nucleoside kinase, partial [Clostridia bacterium]|nr:nucleoside kinase [Clostridia bacterium]